jgi:FkbH-like protein
MNRCSCLLISDFNVKTLGAYLANAEEEPGFDLVEAPYGQVLPVLIDGTLECWQKPVECAVVWTRPEAVIPAFKDVLEFKGASIDTLLAQVDAYAEPLARAAERSRILLVPSWEIAAQNRGWGLLEARKAQGMRGALWRMNARLAERLEGTPNAFVLPADRWMRTKNASSPKMWFTTKTPFSNDVFLEAAQEIRAAVAAQRGQAKKLVIVDLDNTMWGGIVGDLGWESLRLGGHDHAGEAFVEFQRALKALTNRGIILGIVSKNDEPVALEAIEKHPEMVLRKRDFAGWRINWNDKAKNVADLTAELRLGLQSVVFIDDNPVERARVREMLPEVLVPEWPQDPMMYASALQSLRCFDVPSATAEDAARAAMYAAERQRDESMQKIGNIDDWLSSLEQVVTVEPLRDDNLARTTQLLNKTNQLNLTTRRLTEAELTAWTNKPENQLWAFRVADKFGDSGLTGIVSLTNENGVGRISDYVLSCRVMSRKVEETMLAWVVTRAREAGLSKLVATLIPTAKNRPTLDVFKKSGFHTDDDLTFTWDVKNDYPVPSCIKLVVG